MQLGTLDVQLARVVADATKHSPTFAQLAAGWAAGMPPDLKKAYELGSEMCQQSETLHRLLDKLEATKDFQALEAYYTLEVNARRMGAPTLRVMEQFVAWQGSGLVALAENRPIPPLPAGIDESALAASVPSQADPRNSNAFDEPLPHLLPFDAVDFGTVPGDAGPALKVQFERLVRDHEQLVGFGQTFADFDMRGKEMYLGQMAQISARWEELLEAAGAVGLEPTYAYKAMSTELLGRANLSPAESRELVEDVHQLIRERFSREASAAR